MGSVIILICATSFLGRDCGKFVCTRLFVRANNVLNRARGAESGVGECGLAPIVWLRRANCAKLIGKRRVFSPRFIILVVCRWGKCGCGYVP